jgi:hypothetical protein
MNFIGSVEIANGKTDCPWFFTWEVTNDKQPVEYARNLLIKTFLEQTNAQKLFFLDSDVIPPENAFDLLRVKADIVVGQTYVYEHMKGQRDSRMKLVAFHYNHKKLAFDPIVPDGKNMIVDVSGAGTGAMVIDRRVLEDPYMHLDPHYVGLDEEVTSIHQEMDQPNWAPAIFRTRYKANGARLRGEDLDFTLRAWRRGYSLKCHLGVMFGHAKKIDLRDAVRLMSRVVDGVASDLAEQKHAEKVQVENQAKQSAASLRVGNAGGR